MGLADDMSDKSDRLAPGAGGAAYKPYSWVARRWEISNSTLKSWADSGAVPVLRFPSGKRLHSVAHLEALLFFLVQWLFNNGLFNSRENHRRKTLEEEGVRKGVRCNQGGQHKQGGIAHQFRRINK